MKQMSRTARLETGGPAHEVRSVARACDILKAFRGENEPLRINELVERTGLHKATVSRLVGTLVAAGLLRRGSLGVYSCAIQFVERRRYKIGYASQTENSTFAQEVTSGLRHAAEQAGFEMISLDNRLNAKSAIANAERLVKEKVDLAIEFQTFDAVASVVSSILQKARIPVIAIDVPHPGAVYYGANNYEAGLIAGRALGHWARKNWNGEVDEVLLIEFLSAGRLPQLRLTGALAGIREGLPHFPDSRVVRLEGRDTFRQTLIKVRQYLRTHRQRRVLIAAINDDCALGALRAFEEAGVLKNCAVAGHGAVPEARDELRSARTRLIGSVAFFPEKYGAALIRLTGDILSRRSTQPAVFTEHQLITAQNVDRFYGADPVPMRQ
jgi:ribose transport system substrate-binding protein